MVMFRSLRVACVVTLAFIPQAFAGQDLICRKINQASRHYSIVFQNTETGLPCSVVDKTNEQNPRVLWRAEHERSFCQEKIRELVKRLKEQGWRCTATNDLTGLRPVM